MIIQISDRVPDSYPIDRAVGERDSDPSDYENNRANQLFHDHELFFRKVDDKAGMISFHAGKYIKLIAALLIESVQFDMEDNRVAAFEPGNAPGLSFGGLVGQ
jgi:hypothetical protein